jgi:hypothetical protein
MADIKGYVNPRSLGNNEPNQLLRMDIFFEQELWDKYIDNKDNDRRDLYTWDATMLAVSAIPQGVTETEFLKGFLRRGLIGHHKACVLRVYQHPHFMALCVGLAKDQPTGTVKPSRGRAA